MALQRYVVTSTVTVPAGTATAGVLQTVSWAGPASSWAEGWPVTFLPGTVLMIDNAGGAGAALYAAIGAGNLREFVDGQDAVGHGALSN